MVQPIRQPDDRYTYGSLRTWPEGERWELIDGMTYDLSPGPGELHQRALTRLTRFFDEFLEGKPCAVYMAPFDVLLPEGNEVDDDVITVVQPDLLVVCDRAKVTERGVRGTPDLVVEILSPSTMKKDLNEKFNLYQRVGVREYWVVHPQEGLVQVFTLDDQGRYGAPRSYVDETAMPVAILEGLTIDLTRVFAREA